VKAHEITIFDRAKDQTQLFLRISPKWNSRFG
jgi:hypothetical protein